MEVFLCFWCFFSEEKLVGSCFPTHLKNMRILVKLDHFYPQGSGIGMKIPNIGFGQLSRPPILGGGIFLVQKRRCPFKIDPLGR